MKVQGIHVNPRLRKLFDDTPHENRSQAEINSWWCVPYILTTEVDEYVSDFSYEEFVKRIESAGSIRYYPTPSREQWEKDKAERIASFYASYPTGIRYEVRCLDGGAWDRSTNHGFFPTLELAINHAKGL